MKKLLTLALLSSALSFDCNAAAAIEEKSETYAGWALRHISKTPKYLQDAYNDGYTPVAVGVAALAVGVNTLYETVWNTEEVFIIPPYNIHHSYMYDWNPTGFNGYIHVEEEQLTTEGPTLTAIGAATLGYVALRNIFGTETVHKKALDGIRWLENSLYHSPENIGRFALSQIAAYNARSLHEEGLDWDDCVRLSRLNRADLARLEDTTPGIRRRFLNALPADLDDPFSLIQSDEFNRLFNSYRFFNGDYTHRYTIDLAHYDIDLAEATRIFVARGGTMDDHLDPDQAALVNLIQAEDGGVVFDREERDLLYATYNRTITAYMRERDRYGTARFLAGGAFLLGLAQRAYGGEVNRDLPEFLEDIAAENPGLVDEAQAFANDVVDFLEGANIIARAILAAWGDDVPPAAAAAAGGEGGLTQAERNMFVSMPYLRDSYLNGIRNEAGDTIIPIAGFRALVVTHVEYMGRDRVAYMESPAFAASVAEQDGNWRAVLETRYGAFEGGDAPTEDAADAGAAVAGDDELDMDAVD